MGVAAVLRPGVPMGFIDGVPFVAALGAAEAMGARVAWPHDVVGEHGEPLAHVATRAGYDDEGIYVTCELEGDAAGEAVSLGSAIDLSRLTSGLGGWAALLSLAAFGLLILSLLGAALRNRHDAA